MTAGGLSTRVSLTRMLPNVGGALVRDPPLQSPLQSATADSVFTNRKTISRVTDAFIKPVRLPLV